ncbi:hypothetical protein [Methanosarcina horonobensis]|uniref:hypothetical protein n=1 Tax=Methanosarcina horonobensis TaxID=418008 RepID=UPI000B1863B0|nr:hypothetical protein [Methanosarcina horonobensis]
MIACATTDFPHPVSPTRARVSLSPIEKEIPERAVIVFIPLKKRPGDPLLQAAR